MAKHELAWEEEMYDTIIVSKPREFLISFEGQVRYEPPYSCLLIGEQI